MTTRAQAAALVVVGGRTEVLARGRPLPCVPLRRRDRRHRSPGETHGRQVTTRRRVTHRAVRDQGARGALVHQDGKSGARLERISVDEQRYVLKRLHLTDDWVMRATGDLLIRPGAGLLPGLAAGAGASGRCPVW